MAFVRIKTIKDSLAKFPAGSVSMVIVTHLAGEAAHEPDVTAATWHWNALVGISCKEGGRGMRGEMLRK